MLLFLFLTNVNYEITELKLMREVSLALSLLFSNERERERKGLASTTNIQEIIIL